MSSLSTVRMHIVDVLKTLRIASRIGNNKDVPEGTRYIQISDTLAREIEEKLNGCLDFIDTEILERF